MKYWINESNKMYFPVFHSGPSGVMTVITVGMNTQLSLFSKSSAPSFTCLLKIHYCWYVVTCNQHFVVISAERSGPQCQNYYCSWSNGTLTSPRASSRLSRVDNSLTFHIRQNRYASYTLKVIPGLSYEFMNEICHYSE